MSAKEPGYESACECETCLGDLKASSQLWNIPACSLTRTEALSLYRRLGEWLAATNPTADLDEAGKW